MIDLNDLKKDRAKKLDEARAIHSQAEAEGRELNRSEQKQFDDLMAEIDRRGKNIMRQERLMNEEAGIRNPITGDPTQLSGGYGMKHNIADFLLACRFSDMRQKEYREMSLTTGSAGGFLIPDQFRPDILALKPEEALVRPRATIIPAGSPQDAPISGPALSQGTAGVFGGVTVTWIGEGGTKPETTPALLEITLEPKEVAAHVIVTDKLLRNAPSAGPWIGNILRQAVTAEEDYQFLTGDGVGKPKGILNATGAIDVARNTGTDFKFADVGNMLVKLLPGSYGKAIWVMNQSVMPKLLALVDAGNHAIFIGGDASKGMPPTLLGIPIWFTGRTPVLGTRGDVLLVDFSYYLIKDGSGPFVEASNAVYFTTNKTVIKVFWNVDGDGWVPVPLTLKDGVSTVSPYVVLV